MKVQVRLFLLSVLGVSLIILSTAGVGFKQARPINDLTIHVPGKVIESNIDQLVMAQKDAADRKLFDLYPAALNPEEQNIAVPLAEGFNNAKDGLPANIKPMWENSVMILGTSDDGASIGSGFFINIKSAAAGAYKGYILTNHHVIADYCDAAGNCDKLFVLHDIGLDTDTGSVFSTGSNLLRVHGAKLLKMSTTPDLALLEVDLDAVAVNFLKIASVQTSNAALVGQQVYAIGFPATSRRTSSGRKPIEKQNLIIERWSEGSVEQLVSPEGLGDLVIHSADILPGNSGSALYNQSATVVGVNVLLFNPSKDFDYYGSAGGCSRGAATERASVAPSMLAPYLGLLNTL